MRPTLAEMARRRDDVVAKGLPWLVARAGRRASSATPTPTSSGPAPAYRFCLEDSVYLAPEATGRGFGRLLLAELLARCEAAGARQMLAVIGDSANAGVDRRAPRARLRPAGTLAAAGWKFDRWLDVVRHAAAPRSGRHRRAGATPA